MSRATLKPIVSKLREAIIKGVAGKLEKYGFDENGSIIVSKPLSEYDVTIRDNLEVLFKVKHVNSKEKYIDYIHNTSRTFMHILICFKLMEKRGIMGSLLERVVNTDIYNEIIPDFVNVSPLAFDEFVNLYNDNIESLANKDGNEEDNEYYQFVLLMEKLTHEMSKEVPLLFKEYEYNLIQPDYDDMRRILQIISEITGNEYQEDDFLGWIYQYWVDTTDAELQQSEAVKEISYSNMIYNEVLLFLEKEQTEFGEFYTPRVVVKHIVDNCINMFLMNDGNNIENIKLLDPACGAGNFLVYAFDAILNVYDEKYPEWSKREKVLSVLKNNIYGVDVQREPLQITALNLWIKAKTYAVDASIGELNLININVLMANSLFPWELKEEYRQISIFDTPESLAETKMSSEDIGRLISNRNNENYNNAIKIFKNKFNVIVMNPPFVDARKMSTEMSELMKEHYPDNSRNLFGAFIERAVGLLEKNGVLGFISSDTYFTISSFKKIRLLLMKKNIKEVDLIGNGVFDGPAVSAAIMFVENGHKKDNEIVIKDISNLEFENGTERSILQKSFESIDSAPFIFDISKKFMKLLSGKCIGDFKSVFEVRKGIVTSNNDKYLRYKWEIPEKMIGGDFLLYDKDIENIRFTTNRVLDCRKETLYEMNQNPSARLAYLFDSYKDSIQTYDFKSGVLFNLTGNLKVCILEKELFDVSFPAVLCEGKSNLDFIFMLLLSKFAKYCLNLLNSTFHTTPGDVRRLPFVMPAKESFEEMESIVKELVDLKQNCDRFCITSKSYEKSEIGFFLSNETESLGESFEKYLAYCNEEMEKCNNAYERLNNFIYSLYGLENKDITVIERSVGEVTLFSYDRDKKVLFFKYLQSIAVDILKCDSKLFLAEDLDRAIQKYFEEKFINGYEKYEELEDIFDNDITTVIKTGLSFNNKKKNFVSSGVEDVDQPFIMNKVLAGKGKKSEMVVWHISNYLIEFEDDKKYAMQNEIRRLTNDVYLPKLQRAKEKLQLDIISASEKKSLEKEVDLYQECVKTLENWKVVD